MREIDQTILVGTPWDILRLPPVEVLSTSSPYVLPEYHGGCSALLCREKLSPAELGAKYEIDTGLGVVAFTDSELMVKQIGQAFSGKYFQAEWELTYLTKSPVNLEIGGLIPRRMERNNPPDLLVSNDLFHFAVSGPEKFGSVAGLIHGISSFGRIERGFLGLHGAAVLDTKNNLVHVILGAGGEGKSTHARILEESCPGRYLVVSDDWVEICLSNQLVFPISPVIGVSEGDFVAEAGGLERINGMFISFGKSFFVLERAPAVSFKLGQIFQLSRGEINLDNSSLIELFRNFNLHIPFLGPLNGRTEDLPEKVRNRIGMVIRSYLDLCRRKNFHLIDSRYGGIGEVSDRILKILKE